MNAHPSTSGLQFLSVAEAAERLGVSRVKVRDAAARGLIPSKRDNENRLRLDLSGLQAEALDGAGRRVDQTSLMNLLFDEIEELHDALEGRTAEVQALRGIADRQADALDEAALRIERDAADKARLSDLLERALAHLETGTQSGDTVRLADVSERALTALEETGDRLEDSLSQTARFDALLERALEYAALGRAADGADAAAMGATAERAMKMLEAAVSEAETSRRTALQAGDMLGRALQAGERLEQQIAARDREIETKTATVEKVLEMSERAVALAGAEAPTPRRRGFWHWLTGR